MQISASEIRKNGHLFYSQRVELPLSTQAVLNASQALGQMVVNHYPDEANCGGAPMKSPHALEHCAAQGAFEAGPGDVEVGGAIGKSDGRFATIELYTMNRPLSKEEADRMRAGATQRIIQGQDYLQKAKDGFVPVIGADKAAVMKLGEGGEEVSEPEAAFLPPETSIFPWQWPRVNTRDVVTSDTGEALVG